MAQQFRIEQIGNKVQWDEFVQSQSSYTFLHSWNWHVFQQKLGKRSWPLGIYTNNNNLVGVALLIKETARRGSFFHIPHGPLFSWQEEQFETLISHISLLAKKEGVAFLRISPLLDKDSGPAGLFGKIGFRPAPIHMHAETTWTLGLDKPEEALLLAMRKGTRYSIKKAMRDGVEVKISHDSESVERFNRLYQATVAKHHFAPFPLKYLKNEFEAFAPDDRVLTFEAKWQGKLLASAIIYFYGTTAYYHQGASIVHDPKLPPAAHLLQWTVIKKAKARGCTHYNFWGIAPTDNPKHPWQGLTFFKTGFGGYRTDYLHSQDLIYSPKYWMTWLVETARRYKRGL